MKTSRDHLIDLKINLTLATDALVTARVSSTRPLYTAAAALACNCIELGESILHLASCKSKAGLPVLLRSLLESTMRLVLLAKELDAGEASLELTDNLERLKLFEPEQSDQHLAESLHNRNDELRKLGAKKYSFRELLKRVDRGDDYESYRVFSAFAHSQLSALVQHFFDRSEGQTVIHVNVEPNEQLLALYYAGAEHYVGVTFDAVQHLFHQIASLKEMSETTDSDSRADLHNP